MSNKMKRLILLFLFLTASCARHSPWIYQEVISDSPQFNSYQLTYTPNNLFNGLEMQLIRGQFGLIGFFNVYCREITSDSFSLMIDGNSSYYTGILMKGGQRLQLPTQATAQISAALLEGHRILATLSGYSTWIEPANFAKVFL